MKKQNAQTLLHVKRNKRTKRDKTDMYLWGEETFALKEAAETRRTKGEDVRKQQSKPFQIHPFV